MVWDGRMKVVAGLEVLKDIVSDWFWSVDVDVHVAERDDVEVVFWFCEEWNGNGKVVDELLADFIVFFVFLLDCVCVYDCGGDGGGGGECCDVDSAICAGTCDW